MNSKERIEVILYFREDNVTNNIGYWVPNDKKMSLLNRIINQLKKLNTSKIEYVVTRKIWLVDLPNTIINYTEIYKLLQPKNNNKVVLLTNVDIFCRNLDLNKIYNFESWEAEYKKLTDSLNEIEILIKENHNKHIISEPELLRLTASKSFYNKGSLKKLTLPTITCKQKKVTNGKGGMEYTISYNIKPSNKKNVSGQNFQRLFNEENIKNVSDQNFNRLFNENNEEKVNNNKKIYEFTNKNISNFSEFFNKQNRNISGNNLKKLFNQNLLSERLYIIKKAYTSANEGIKIGVKKDELIKYINELNRYSFSSTFYIQELIRNVLEFKFYVFKGEIIYYMINDFFDDINKVITKNKKIEVPHYSMFPKNFKVLTNTWQTNSGYPKNRLIEKNRIL